MRRPLAFPMSLVVFGVTVWAANAVFGQVFPGNPIGGGGSGGGGGGTTLPVADTQTIVKGSADPTKLLRFEVDGYTTGTTRVITFQDSDYTVPGLAITNTFTGQSIFSSNNAGVVIGPAGSLRFAISTAQTPDQSLLGTGATSNALLFAEQADANFDFAHAATTHPTIFVHSTNQSATEYLGISASGTQTELFKALTESAATDVVQIPIAAGTATGGIFLYNIRANDATNTQSRVGRVMFSAVNESGTEACVLGTPEEIDNTPTGTLTVTVTCSTAGANAIMLQLNAVSSLTQTTLRAYYSVFTQGPGSPLPQ